MPLRPRRSTARLGVIAGALATILLAAAASGVAAHVNRTVGPYAILVILVEEPVYADNRAGFEFWVRRDEVPILGLEHSIKAVATGHGEQVDLAIPPIDGTGFYVLDHTTDGTAFDPHGGGAWTLVLSGAIDGTPVDATFPVTFPSYPRIGAAATTPGTTVGAGAVAPPAGGPPFWLIGLLAIALVGAIGAIAMASRRRQRGAKRPVLTT